MKQVDRIYLGCYLFYESLLSTSLTLDIKIMFVFLHSGLVIFDFLFAIRDKHLNMLLARVKWCSGRVSRENLDIMRQQIIRLFKIFKGYPMD